MISLPLFKIRRKMIKIVTIIGARPQIIKAAALSRAIETTYPKLINEVIVHTGQHYDHAMSEVFFNQLGIPPAAYNMGVGSGSHGAQTARMLEQTESILMKEKPQFLVVYGDTNSTLAGALAAVKLKIPVVHIEAGLRSFNKEMPEEINRIACDHVSTLLFSPTKTGINNLVREGFILNNEGPFSPDNPGVFHCGDIMYDNTLYFTQKALKESQILEQLNLTPNKFILCTIHRDHNTDNTKEFVQLFEALIQTSENLNMPIVLPAHPRTIKAIQERLPKELVDKLESGENLRIVAPLDFFDMIAMEHHCRFIMTDSGGVQKEAYFLKKDVVILRNETEWVEVVESGHGFIVGTDPEKIDSAVKQIINQTNQSFPSLFGDGRAAQFICNEMLKNLTA